MRDKGCTRSVFRRRKIGSRLTEEFRGCQKVVWDSACIHSLDTFIEKITSEGKAVRVPVSANILIPGRRCIVATVFSRFLRSSALTQREEILHPYPGALSARVSLPEGGTKARRTDDAKSVARSGAGRIVASKYAHFFFPFSLSLSLSLSLSFSLLSISRNYCRFSWCQT